MALPLSGCYAKRMLTQSAASLAESGPWCVRPLAAMSLQVQHVQQLYAATGLLQALTA